MYEFDVQVEFCHAHRIPVLRRMGTLEVNLRV